MWIAVSKAVSRSPTSTTTQLTALHAAPAPGPSEGNSADLRATVKAPLMVEERGLLDAIRKAPSAADIISADLEKIASQRRVLEHELKALDAAQDRQNGGVVDRADVDAFCRAVKPYLKAMDVAEKRKLLSLLGFEATVADSGEVKASIAVPRGPDVFTIARTSA